jgi:hypothetical protein
MTVAAATVPGILQFGTHAARPAATAVAAGTLYSCSTHGLVYQSDGASWTNWTALGVGFTVALPVVIGDGTIVVSTGSKGLIEIPFACTITAVRLMADASGSCVIDLKKATYSGLPTTASICASAKPTLSSAQKSQDTTLTGWTTAITAGDWIEVNVDSASTIKRVTLSLTLLR